MEFDLTTGTAVLERTPRTLRAMLTGLPSAWIDATEGPETWSPYVIVGHLIHGDRTDWIPRAQIILAQGSDRRFTPYDRFAQFRESKGKTMTFIVMETDIWSSGIPSNRIFMSSTDSIATPALPTSPTTRGWSES